eukprot:gnl/TRDRNA2_/TRDRNA2_60165_c0_seq1.p1 gnl/TRDRNA2_/TRDRNA2_60165_c0~~gnl/TRDRNA2_/TRDRNA2_60165_c0_seq1.p1  ORF type:complete len:320 (+),score=35.89 gnl/TRDRNA2_/TRDRNA2_60165_c0_seq1:73-960(+)
MSYSTQDRYGDVKNFYPASTSKSTEPVGTGCTWWPDYGPTQRDYSYQHRWSSTRHIFDKVVHPASVGFLPPEPPSAHVLADRQFRNPNPALHGMLKTEHEPHEHVSKARDATKKQGRLNMLADRQKKIDSWLPDAPVLRAPPGLTPLERQRAEAQYGQLSRSRSESSLIAEQCSELSRETFEKHGWLVGRSKGSPADGRSGMSGTRRHNSLSFNSMLFGGELIESGGGAARSSKKSKRPGNQWRVCPENSFQKGGILNDISSTNLSHTTASQGSSKREWSAPTSFDWRPAMESTS